MHLPHLLIQLLWSYNSHLQVSAPPSSTTFVMAIARPIRALGLLVFVLVTLMIWTITKPAHLEPDFQPDTEFHDPNADSMQQNIINICEQYFWLSLVTGEPQGILRRANEGYAPGPGSKRINATILSLVRNSEIDQLVQSMKDLERTWNHKFNYPWTFFNDVEFTPEFKKRTQAETNAECRYGMVHPIYTNHKRINS